MHRPEHEASLLKRVARSLGPGFITGAADDDPSGIATYAQTGVMFGFSQLWIVLFSYPFMTAMQEMCGRIGLVTGRGLAGVIRKRYARSVLGGAVLLLLIANTINIGADLGAMAASVGLVVPLPFAPALAIITLVTLALEIWVPYPSYARVLKYLTFSLLAYVVTAFVVAGDWGAIAHATIVPHLFFSKEYVFNIAAFLGTTISPYLFFWQADEEVEEEIVRGQLRGMGRGVPKVRRADIRRMRLDTALGMLFSNLITFFIIVSVASTLGGQSSAPVATAADVASALKPLAGDFAFLLFALGILGTGLLAVPVLAGSAGYAVAEALGWPEGLGLRPNRARGFYGVIAAATLVGLLANFTAIEPMTLLYYAAMVNGVLAPPLMFIVLAIANDKKVMGERTNGALANIAGLTITIIMSGIALVLGWQLLHP